ncbi:restriction endonuclease [Paraburkholderia elongata]|uniref:Restriction endonuclease n=1 Tax=Paraburkholderia elongata TaxID=2675747 RepID=A0A972SMP8_9BURK|nr:restriction endonuclease [Paraburkholderia elongata]NPT60494.1 restriction endonuclease [Paraburkholderia elongata]
MSGEIVRRRSRKRKQSVFDAGRVTGARLVSPTMGGPLAVLFGLAAVVWVGSHLDTQAAESIEATAVVAALVVVGVFWFKQTERTRKRRDLMQRQQGLDSIRALAWDEFEEFVGELYRLQGFEVQSRLRGGADGGVDLILERGGGKTLVQCKHWKSTTVGAPVVREMMGLITHHGAVSAKIVCSGKFTRQAIQFAEGKPIELVSGEALWLMVEAARRPSM